jgi:nicotinate dehydrogenase subunit B
MSLPASLAANPRLSTWVGLDVPGVVTVRVGKVEVGQGILTALAQIAADELDVEPHRITMAAASTSGSPDEGVTSGSRSISDSGAALRQVCAEVRAVLVDAAAAKFGVWSEELTVVDGIIRDADGFHAMSYWQLAAGLLDRDADGSAVPKTLRGGTVIGTSPPRIDLPDKITGRPRFIHDLVLAGQLFGRVVRPPTRSSVLKSLDDVDLPGVTVVRDGGFLGVIAAREEVAVRAAAALGRAARWSSEPHRPDLTELRGQPAESLAVLDDPGSPADVAAEVSASYSRPYLAHASIAPSCGIAVWYGNELHVWTHSQHIHGLRGAIIAAIAMPELQVVVRHVEGAGCYGHNGADDAAYDAVLLARAVPGRPVQVVWSRADELAWSPLGPAMAVDIKAGLSGSGRIASWQHTVWSPGHTTRPGYADSPGLLGAALVSGVALPPAVDPPLPAGGAARNAIPYYEIPHRHITAHRLLRPPLRTSALRSLGAHLNIVAIEATMDELAAVTGRDPIEFRLAHLPDERARAVINRVAAASGWNNRIQRAAIGHGIAFARYKNVGGYCAVVAEVEAVDRLIVRRLVIAVDVGQVVNPDGVCNQIEGGAIQSCSWTVCERVEFAGNGVTTNDWENYPILRFPDVPAVHIDLIDRPDQPSLGAGEAAQGPTAAAIVNALRDVLGVAVRDLPLSSEQIAHALRAL